MEEKIILNKKSNKKKVILLSMLLLIVIAGTIGVAYAVYRFQTEGDSSELITGDIYMHYKGKNAGISIEDAVPSKTYDPKEYFEFTIDGKNTYTEKDIWYEIDLVHGEQPEGRTIRINDKFLRFRLTEQIGDSEEKTVVNSVGYDDITNKKIWVNKIDKNTNEEIKITYRLYMWISDEVHIGYDDEEEIEFDYSTDEWTNNIYASVKVNVKGDFEEKNQDLRPLPEDLSTNLLERIKKLAYYRDGEVIAIDVTDKSNITKCDSINACKEKIIEYRYSGPEVNNYIYLKDNNNSNELWRIIGVFEDDEVGEYIKVVRDNMLPENYLPETFKVSNDKIYRIKTLGKENLYKVYYNNLTGTEDDKNNWPTAGLQYWLNAEEKDTEGNNNYLSYLSDDVRAKLVKVKYYLGTPTYDTGIEFSTINSYKYERATECNDGKGAITAKDNFTSSEKCRVWKDNDATWTGKVSLIYPSDYGFSGSEEYWSNTSLRPLTSYGAHGTSWMYISWGYRSPTGAQQSWVLSPSNNKPTYGSYYEPNGMIANSGYPVYSSTFGVLPVLSLSSSTTWLDGDGTKNNPYKIIAD